MSKESERGLLRLNASMPSGSKKRSAKLKSSKKKDLAPTPTKKIEAAPAQAKPPEFDVEYAQSVVFQPNPGPQTQYLASSEREVLYGGAAGGGKSYATLADPLRNLNNQDFSGLLVRHTT